jgi:hypothetical protein
MRLWLRIVIGILLIVFVAGLFPALRTSRITNNVSFDSSQFGPIIIAIGVSLWAIYASFHTDNVAYKALLYSIAIVLIVALAVQITVSKGYVQSMQFAVTPLYYLFSILVLLAVIVESINYRRKQR